MPTRLHPTPLRQPSRWSIAAATIGLAASGLAAASPDRDEERAVRTAEIRASIEASRSLPSDPVATEPPAVLSLAALEDDETDALLRNDRGLTVEVVAGVWLARLGGDVSLGENGTVFRIDRRIRNDDLEATPLVELSFLDDEGFILWRLHGFDFSSEGSGPALSPFTFGSLSFAAGDTYETRTDMTSAGVERVLHRWTAVEPGSSSGPGVGQGDARLDLSVIGGLRWIAVDQEITRPGVGTESPSADWLVASLAARYEFTWAPEGGFILGRSFRITGEYGIGPGLNAGGGLAWHVRAGAELEFTESIRGYFGYRLLELGLDEGDWEFDSGLQGLFVGATIQF